MTTTTTTTPPTTTTKATTTTTTKPPTTTTKPTTTTTKPTTTPEPMTPCGKFSCKTRTEYCSSMHTNFSNLFSDMCHSRQDDGTMCTRDKECMSNNCKWVFSKFSFRCA